MLYGQPRPRHPGREPRPSPRGGSDPSLERGEPSQGRGASPHAGNAPEVRLRHAGPAEQELGQVRRSRGAALRAADAAPPNRGVSARANARPKARGLPSFENCLGSVWRQGGEPEDPTDVATGNAKSSRDLSAYRRQSIPVEGRLARLQERGDPCDLIRRVADCDPGTREAAADREDPRTVPRTRWPLPAGVIGAGAIYTEHVHHVAIMRKILLRMVSWQNYVFGELH